MIYECIHVSTKQLCGGYPLRQPVSEHYGYPPSVLVSVWSYILRVQPIATGVQDSGLHRFYRWFQALHDVVSFTGWNTIGLPNPISNRNGLGCLTVVNQRVTRNTRFVVTSYSNIVFFENKWLYDDNNPITLTASIINADSFPNRNVTIVTIPTILFVSSTHN